MPGSFQQPCTFTTRPYTVLGVYEGRTLLPPGGVTLTDGNSSDRPNNILFTGIATSIIKTTRKSLGYCSNHCFRGVKCLKLISPNCLYSHSTTFVDEEFINFSGIEPKKLMRSTSLPYFVEGRDSREEVEVLVLRESSFSLSLVTIIHKSS